MDLIEEMSFVCDYCGEEIEVLNPNLKEIRCPECLQWNELYVSRLFPNQEFPKEGLWIL